MNLHKRFCKMYINWQLNEEKELSSRTRSNFRNRFRLVWSHLLFGDVTMSVVPVWVGSWVACDVIVTRRTSLPTRSVTLTSSDANAVILFERSTRFQAKIKPTVRRKKTYHVLSNAHKLTIHILENSRFIVRLPEQTVNKNINYFLWKSSRVCSSVCCRGCFTSSTELNTPTLPQCAVIQT